MFRFCTVCGIKAPVFDELQRRNLDAIGFGDMCPDCSGEPSTALEVPPVRPRVLPGPRNGHVPTHDRLWLMKRLKRMERWGYL